MENVEIKSTWKGWASSSVRLDSSKLERYGNDSVRILHEDIIELAIPRETIIGFEWHGREL